MWQMGVGYANGGLLWVSHRASIRDNDQAGWRSVRQRLIVLQLHQGCPRGHHDTAGHRRSVDGRAGDVGCVLEARAVGCRPTALQFGAWPPPTEVARTCECRCGGPGWAAQRTRPLLLPAPTGPPAAAAAAAQPLLSPGWFAGAAAGLGCRAAAAGPGGPPQRTWIGRNETKRGGSALFWDS